MMQEKIGTPGARARFVSAVGALEMVCADLGDIEAMLFVLATPNEDWEPDPRAIRGALLAIERVRSNAESAMQRISPVDT